MKNLRPDKFVQRIRWLQLLPAVGILTWSSWAQAATDCATVTEISPTECGALVALYKSTTGPDWYDNQTNNWNVTMTRTQPWLAELQPQMFVEMSEELAQLKGIKNGERVKVASARGSVQCSAMVTKRFKPMKIAGTTVHEVGIPWHFGWRWPSNGQEESANLLTSGATDPNTRIPETKAFMVNVSKI